METALSHKAQGLPLVIPESLILQAFQGVQCLKHRTALLSLYALGLRRQELLNLKLSDICRSSLSVKIVQGKGGKDRILPISPDLLKLWEKYYRFYTPQVYLFEGATPGQPYSATSLRMIFYNAFYSIIGHHKYHLHSLRHSFATHLLDHNKSLRDIQTLLGHANISSTAIYLSLSVERMRKSIEAFESLISKVSNI